MFRTQGGRQDVGTMFFSIGTQEDSPKMLREKVFFHMAMAQFHQPHLLANLSFMEFAE